MVMKITIQITLMLEIVRREMMMMITMILIMIMMMKTIMTG